MGRNFWNRTCTEHKIAGMIRRYETRGEEWAEANEKRRLERLSRNDPEAYLLEMERQAREEENREIRRRTRKNVFLGIMCSWFVFAGLYGMTVDICFNSVGLFITGLLGFIGIKYRIKWGWK